MEWMRWMYTRSSHCCGPASSAPPYRGRCGGPPRRAAIHQVSPYFLDTALFGVHFRCRLRGAVGLTSNRTPCASAGLAFTLSLKNKQEKEKSVLSPLVEFQWFLKPVTEDSSSNVSGTFSCVWMSKYQHGNTLTMRKIVYSFSNGGIAYNSRDYEKKFIPGYDKLFWYWIFVAFPLIFPILCVCLKNSSLPLTAFLIF